MSSSNVLLLCLCGLPGSGKTTLCHALRDASGPLTVSVVSYDDNAPSTPWSPESWHTGRAASHHMVALRLREALAQPLTTSPHTRVVVVDDNSWLPSMRRSLWVLAREARAAYATLYLDLGEGGGGVEVARLRDEGRGRVAVGKEVIARMAGALHPPPPPDRHGRGAWEAKHSWRVSALGTPESVAECVLGRLMGGMGGFPVPPLPPPPLTTLPLAPHGTAATSTSLLHRIDLALRAEVAALVAFHSSGREGRGIDGKFLAAAKGRALAYAKGLGGGLEGSVRECGGEEETSGGGGGGEEGLEHSLRVWSRAQLQAQL